MELIEKRYPYPVLLPGGGDYPGCEFKVSGQYAIVGGTVTLTFNASLNCQSLQELVEQGKAQVICHVECSQSAYRQAFNIPFGESQQQIESGSLSGKVSICPFIVACQDIPDYSSSLLDKAYDGMSFHLGIGAILAEGEQLRLFVETAREDLEYQPDIFSVLPHEYTDDSKDLMLISLNEDKIHILLPKKSWTLYKQLRKSGEVNEMLWSAFAVPALIEAINEMKNEVTSGEGIDGLDSSMWCSVLAANIQKLFPDVDKDPVEVYRNIDACKVAQMLAKRPISRMLQKLSKVPGNDADNQEEEA